MQSIGAINFEPTTLIVGKTATASATTSAGLRVSFTSNTQEICLTSGKTVTGLTVGNCILIAKQGGNVNYQNAPPLTGTIPVYKGKQEIIWGALPTLMVDGTGTLLARNKNWGQVLQSNIH